MPILLAAVAAGELPQVAAKDWCVTRGQTSDGRVTVPKLRAVAPGTDGNRAELRFTYRGSTDATAPLGSGELRRQLGLKLRAQDGCNLLYVMWRIEPKPQVVVSVKRNPGQRTHAQCGNNGYRNLRGTGAQPALITPGEPHILRAELNGFHLRVQADEVLVFDADVPADVALLVGPAGLRTDNVRADLDLRASRGSAATPCGPSSDED